MDDAARVADVRPGGRQCRHGRCPAVAAAHGLSLRVTVMTPTARSTLR